MTEQPFDTSRVEPVAASEKHLIERAQRGEERAFEALFEAHKRRVYSLCLHMTHDPADAEDLSQEAFLRVFRKISDFRGESAFSTWLYRIVVNIVLMHRRKRKPQEVSLDESDTFEGKPIRPEYGEDDRHLLGSIDRIALDQAIAELPPGYRAVFVLHDVQGCEHNEVAQIMNTSIGNSKSQLHRARLRLREWLRNARLKSLSGQTVRVQSPDDGPRSEEYEPRVCLKD